MTQAATTIGDHFVDGTLHCKQLSITDSTNKIAANLVNGNHIFRYSQETGADAAADAGSAIGAAFGVGTLKGVYVGSVVAATGNSTVTVDVKKDGVSVLSSTVVLDSTNVAYTPESGTLDSSKTTMAATDILTVVITVSAGTGTLPQGVYVFVSMDQNYPH